MNEKSKITEALMSFCVCTACITILEGILGMMFFPEQKLGYEAFFSPPLFGAFSVLLGCVTWSKKELSVKQILFRRSLHLLLIEGMVFGLNYAAGVVFPPMVCIALAIGIATVFVMVYVILWMNDRRSARIFNRKLKEFQVAKANSETV